MSLGYLRKALYGRLDWAPNVSAAQLARTNLALNEAVQQVAKDLPTAFFEASFDLSLPAVFDSTQSGVENDTLNVSPDDRWVLQRNVTWAVGDIGTVPLSRLWGLWDGHAIEFDHAGRRYRGQVRHTFVDPIGAPPTDLREMLSLVSPIEIIETGGLIASIEAPYRVWLDRLPLPAGILSLKSIRLQVDGGRALEPIEIHEAERRGYLDGCGATGIPQFWWRAPTEMLPTPTQAPPVTTSATVLWGASPATEPAGTFEYCFTYCWGVMPGAFEREGAFEELFAGGAPVNAPLWESAPSPASATVGTTWGGNQVAVALPDLEHMLGFGASTSKRYRQSGWYKRIYRRRKSIVAGGGVLAIPASDRFHLVGMANGSTTIWYDTGAAVPDLHKSVHPDEPRAGQHTAIGVWPRPASDVCLTVRAAMAPAPLLNDADTPPCDAAAWTAILAYAEYRMRTSLGMDGAASAFAEYQQVELPMLSKRFGSGTPSSHVGRRKSARVGGGWSDLYRRGW